MEKSDSIFEEWGILELMGHRKLAGLVKEETIGGASFIRIDIPDGKGEFQATQFYNLSAVYCMTPTSKELAAQVAVQNTPAPVTRWELPAAPEPRSITDDSDLDSDSTDDEDDIPY